MEKLEKIVDFSDFIGGIKYCDDNSKVSSKYTNIYEKKEQKIQKNL